MSLGVRLRQMERCGRPAPQVIRSRRAFTTDVRSSSRR
ncbi:MAG: hypothetical protein AVDCRST_MAG34-1759 [uncultured Nocardioidaceae bacterium]|uniref:Uncharacterized protein n=1 Tax=uncultured Nocardioidaceae bacterium TaxID=253824 RepID=A0A6J4M5U5_9ACTN|nr:MAG: hypothetical protein AVDCRST_MAG34-1759 [uncultured Nocardioidaceae bacterium]